MTTLHPKTGSPCVETHTAARTDRAWIVERANAFIELRAHTGVTDPSQLGHCAIVDTLRSILGQESRSFDPRDGWPSLIGGGGFDPVDCDPGFVYESMLAFDVERTGETSMLVPMKKGARKAAGAFYTPEPLVEHLLDSALDPILDARQLDGADGILSIRVCDPACGSGRFLLAAARRIAARLCGITGEDADMALARVIDRCIYGVDLDPIAVELCIEMLSSAGGSRAKLRDHLRIGNSLLGVTDPTILREGCRSCDAWCARLLGSDPRPNDALFHWGIEFPGVCGPDAQGFDVVVGNPPYLNQLARVTASERRTAALLRACCAEAVGGYADLAVAFLVRSLLLCADGGRVSLVLPQSMLVVDDAQPARAFVLGHAALVALWVSNEHVFEDAGVYTCAPTLEKSGDRVSALRRTSTGSFMAHDPIRIDNDELRTEATWGRLGAGTIGVPDVVVRRDRTLADVAHATADFRDQYYGLRGSLISTDDLKTDRSTLEHLYPRLLTSGLIDLARCQWNERTTRVHKQTWRRPRIDRSALLDDTMMSSWIDRRLIPKVLLATQTRVIEVFVDHAGLYVPSVPIISIFPNEEGDLWRVAAALGSPVSTMIALRDHFGAAMSIGALKMSAKNALRLPMPPPGTPLDSAADSLRAAHNAKDDPERLEHLRAFARACGGFSGLSKRHAREVETWWLGRLRGGGTRNNSG